MAVGTYVYLVCTELKMIDNLIGILGFLRMVVDILDLIPGIRIYFVCPLSEVVLVSEYPLSEVPLYIYMSLCLVSCNRIWGVNIRNPYSSKDISHPSMEYEEISY